MNVAVTSLSSQLNSLLDISELDSGSVQPDMQQVDLHRLSHSLMSEMSKLAEDKHIALQNEMPEQLFVRTDPSMLSQIIRNLCGNAIKYTHEGSVTLTARQTSEGVVMSIVDTGVGISTKESDRVFEEYYQVSKHTRDKNVGMGLGLSIVERLINILDHRISMSSQLGEGTTVSIIMQACDAITLPQIERRAPQSHLLERLPEGFWVHLVDDDVTVQNSVRIFRESVGARVTVSETSKSAIDFLKANLPDALLLDLHLRDGDSGLSVVDFIDELTLPVAVITGQTIDDSIYRERYPHLLMLQKPLTDEALLELLEYMAEPAQAS